MNLFQSYFRKKELKFFRIYRQKKFLQELDWESIYGLTVKTKNRH